ncbi:uncharacterized protein DFL_002310 [Arthrobotrys flagrans]|uniref:Mei2-like C-terminal RNA recognition motif domain-containing protein n=1 Tax=Arthrobotrys flagrans TaxID=97331 RepID=A0A437AA55_ARTFL|nr:hypothetical protein DFL_002310 [Arthrobotrys flagrans]
MTQSSANHYSNPVGGPLGLPVGYVPEFQIPAGEMAPSTLPPGLLEEEAHANGMNEIAGSGIPSQHITKAIRGGAEGKIIEYYCVPEVDRDVGIVPTRHLKCTGVPGGTSPSGLKGFFEQFGDVSGLFVEKLMSNGVLYVSFFNLQASIHCYRDVQLKWPATYCARTTLENVVNNFAAHPLTTEGEVQVDVLGGHCDTQTIVGALGTFGDLHTVQTYRNNDVSTVFAEFYDIRQAAMAIHHLNGQQVGGLEIRVNWPEAERIAWTKASQMIEIHEDQNVCVVHAGSSELVNDARRIYGIPFASGLGASQELTRNHCGRSNTLVRGHSGAMALYGPDSPPRYDVGINRNILDLHNVRNGIDLRTTIMIRNIPNHLPQSVIKAWLDEVSYRKYDFLYLRIDFANHCNVGYCFVNYLSLADIVDFVQRRVGTRWSQFGSDKIVEVSYANIQGKAALIEKFRNSSVMDQPFEFRPRAFHSTGENFGLDMEFPPPNNLNRKLRSVTAAEHSGLYSSRYRNGYGYYQPARFGGGFGHHRGGGYGNFGHRHFGNGNGYGMNRLSRTNRLAITMPGYEPTPYRAPTRVQTSIPPGAADGFVGAIPVNGGIAALSHRSATSFGAPNAGITSPAQFQSARFPTPTQAILHSETRIRQENVPPRPTSSIGTQGIQAQQQIAHDGTGIRTPATNGADHEEPCGPHTPSMVSRYDNVQRGGPGVSIYSSPLSPAGLVNAGYVPTNPAPPGFSASTFADALGERSTSQGTHARSPTDYEMMARNLDAMRRIWEQ